MSDDTSAASGRASPPVAELETLAASLRSLGYSIETPRRGDPPDRDLIARRDLGDRVILFSADNGGRFRIDITWLVGEWPSRQEIAGVVTRVVDRVSRSVNLVGQAQDTTQLAEVAAGLGMVVAWADDGARGEPASGGPTASGELPPPP